MKNTNEELIVEAFPNEQYIDKLIQNDPSSIEKIILKYLKDCLHGSQRVEDYKDCIVNQLTYLYYHDLLDYHLKELTTIDCYRLIEDYKIMIPKDWEFLKKNYYYLKQFPIYKDRRTDYFVEKWNFIHVYLPMLLKQIEENKKENETL